MSTPLAEPSAESQASEPIARARRLVELGSLVARTYNRPDLEASLQMALSRIDRPETLIAVIGEFKQGKSSLVNALLRVEAAVVDDDLATAALALFSHGETASATVTTSRAGEESTEEVSFAEARRYMSETTNPENVLGVRMVQVRIPAEFLSTGAILIDTPGFGGLALGSSGTTLAYLHNVDAVVFVSDASAPLAGPELEFLRRAIEACPAVLMVLTKTDLYPEWRRIAEIDASVLEAAGLDVPILFASNVLMTIGLAEGNESLMTASGVPVVGDIIGEMVLDSMKLLACGQGLAKARDAVQQVLETLLEGLAALEDASGAALRQATLEQRREHLDHLRGPAARWTQVLGDAFADTAGDAEHRFRASLRDVSRTIEDEIEKIDPGKEWDDLSTRLRDRVGEATDQLIADLHEGARAAEQAILALLRDSESVTISESDRAIDARGLWSAKTIDRPSLTTFAGTMFSGVRGGSGGITTIGVLAGLAGVTLATAATAGIGIAFGGKQILDERKRQLQSRRQQARSAARQFVEDVQFEASKRSRDLTRDLHRNLRDHFVQRVAELQRGCTESLAAIQSAIQKDVEERPRQLAFSRERADEVEQLIAAMAEVEQSL